MQMVDPVYYRDRFMLSFTISPVVALCSCCDWPAATMTAIYGSVRWFCLVIAAPRGGTSLNPFLLPPNHRQGAVHSGEQPGHHSHALCQVRECVFEHVNACQGPSEPSLKGRLCGGSAAAECERARTLSRVQCCGQCCSKRACPCAPTHSPYTLPPWPIRTQWSIHARARGFALSLRCFKRARRYLPRPFAGGQAAPNGQQPDRWSLGGPEEMMMEEVGALGGANEGQLGDAAALGSPQELSYLVTR